MIDTGDLIDERHEVERSLGRGGTAEVFRARDTKTGRSVAIKLLTMVDPRSMTRFRSEIEVLSRLDHPGVVRLRGAGSHEDVPYLVLDLVDGPSLADVLDSGPLGLDRSISIGHQLAEALAYAHGLGIVHRDVKPANVIVDADPTSVRLADFGIARLSDSTRITAAGRCVGTAAYLAPEQLEGQVGPAADVYALGLVVLECLTGRRCYSGTPAEATMARLHRSPVVPTSLPPWLGHALRAMTARNPCHRPPAAAVGDAFGCRSIDAVLASTFEVEVSDLPTGTSPSGTAEEIERGSASTRHDRALEPSWDPRERRRPLLLAFGGGALTAAAALALSLMVWPGGSGVQAIEPQTPTASAVAVELGPLPRLPTGTPAGPPPARSPTPPPRADLRHEDAVADEATSEDEGHNGNGNGQGRGNGPGEGHDEDDDD